jgi:hypothetical protein
VIKTKIFGGFTKHRFSFVFLLPVTSLLFVACSQLPAEPSGQNPAEEARATTGERYADYEIITVLPRDAISAIDEPVFVSIEQADETYTTDELILGVEFNGDARAYSIPLLSSHEIVNDVVGGRKIAVTW